MLSLVWRQLNQHFQIKLSAVIKVISSGGPEVGGICEFSLPPFPLEILSSIRPLRSLDGKRYPTFMRNWGQVAHVSDHFETVPRHSFGGLALAMRCPSSRCSSMDGDLEAVKPTSSLTFKSSSSMDEGLEAALLTSPLTSKSWHNKVQSNQFNHEAVGLSLGSPLTLIYFKTKEHATSSWSHYNSYSWPCFYTMYSIIVNQLFKFKLKYPLLPSLHSLTNSPDMNKDGNSLSSIRFLASSRNPTLQQETYLLLLCLSTHCSIPSPSKFTNLFSFWVLCSVYGY